MTQPINPSQFANMFPGANAPTQAPTPHGGGFDPSFAPPQQPYAPQQAPAMPAGFVPLQQPQFAPQQPAAPNPYAPQPAQTYAPQYAPTQQQYAPTQQQYAPTQQQYAPTPAHQAYAQPAPALDPAYVAQMRQAAMGNGRRQPLPIGDYTAIIEQTEVERVGPPQGRQHRVFFGHVMVETSSNPAVQPGHKGKYSVFIESDYDMAAAMGAFKGHIADLYGIQEQGGEGEQRLWTEHPNWLVDVENAPGPFRGVRVSISVKQKVDKHKHKKFKADGSPDTRTDVRRVG